MQTNTNHLGRSEVRRMDRFASDFAVSKARTRCRAARRLDRLDQAGWGPEPDPAPSPLCILAALVKLARLPRHRGGFGFPPEIF